jgi:hypothetical protein
MMTVAGEVVCEQHLPNSLPELSFIAIGQFLGEMSVRYPLSWNLLQRLAKYDLAMGLSLNRWEMY